MRNSNSFQRLGEAASAVASALNGSARRQPSIFQGEEDRRVGEELIMVPTMSRNATRTRIVAPASGTEPLNRPVFGV